MGVAKIITSAEFREIMNDFTNPLELIREAIQNSIDENANKIIITVRNDNTSSGKSLNIIIEDDGDGIVPDKFENFFDLGNSTKVDDPDKIGEKGHGTKIYYNSNKVTLETWVQYKKYKGELITPYKKIFENYDLDYTDPVEVENSENKEKGTRITIEGYLKNTSDSPLDNFSHPAIKDYILWFTGIGSIKGQFITSDKEPVVLLSSYDSTQKSLQSEFNFSVDSKGYELISFGHLFPSTELVKDKDLKKMAVKYKIRNWEDLFCKKLYCNEISIDGLEKPIHLLIWAEGDKLKRLYNTLIRERISATTRHFQYKVGDRYGFWACKNYIPIQKVDHWITGKGNYTKFHAFVNYDDFSLTANRSSIENTKPEVLSKIKEKVDKVFNEVISDIDYKKWQDLEELASQERSAEVEKKEFIKRLKTCKTRKMVAIGNCTYFEPEYEGEVALLLDGLLQTYPDILKYEILDYNTNKGIDFLVRQKSNIPLENDNTIGYVELKLNLEKGRFNHSFKNLNMILCYDTRGLKIGGIITDLNSESLKVVKNNNNLVLADYNGDVGKSIPILVLKEFMNSKGLKFS